MPSGHTNLYATSVAAAQPVKPSCWERLPAISDLQVSPGRQQARQALRTGAVRHGQVVQATGKASFAWDAACRSPNG